MQQLDTYLSYSEFLKTKEYQHIDAGFTANESLMPERIKQFQLDIVSWACRRGRAAIFADTGLGKTLMQLAWAHQVASHTSGRVLVLAPLCVAQQTVEEGEKFGIDAEYMRSESGIEKQIVVTNYEMLKHFDPANYSGIVLDESSILKGMDGKTRKMITEFAKSIPYRLSCTATPSPNDFMELGTQSEFLSIMSQVEMLATFFIHDGGDTSKWRLKGHARRRFWEWLATWAVVIRTPADLNYHEPGYDLPELRFFEHIVETDPQNDLFVTVAQGMQERNQARRETTADRCKKASDIVSKWGNFIAWCNLNNESEMIASMTDAVEITGSMSHQQKESAILGFTHGEIESIVTKPKIAGFGLNWQHCNKMIFVGLSDSFESFYQSVRRCWRFGQTKPVEVHIVISDREGSVLANILRKQQQHDQMSREMVSIMRDLTISEIKGATIQKADYSARQEIKIPSFMQ